MTQKLDPYHPKYQLLKTSELIQPQKIHRKEKDLEKQKNQLLIEKKEVEEQYTFILKENQELKKLIEEIK